jgi:hypothetical protein
VSRLLPCSPYSSGTCVELRSAAKFNCAEVGPVKDRHPSRKYPQGDPAARRGQSGLRRVELALRRGLGCRPGQRHRTDCGMGTLEIRASLRWNRAVYQPSGRGPGRGRSIATRVAPRLPRAQITVALCTPRQSKELDHFPQLGLCASARSRAGAARCNRGNEKHRVRFDRRGEIHVMFPTGCWDKGHDQS